MQNRSKHEFIRKKETKKRKSELERIIVCHRESLEKKNCGPFIDILRYCYMYVYIFFFSAIMFFHIIFGLFENQNHFMDA